MKPVPPRGPSVFEAQPLSHTHGRMLIGGIAGGKTLVFRSPMKNVRVCHDIPVTVIDMRDRTLVKRPLPPDPYRLDG